MIGTTRDYKGQLYTLVTAFERDRRDGSVATILIWESPCADCDHPFTLTTPAAASKFQPNRRCAKHKRPGQRVKGGA